MKLNLYNAYVCDRSGELFRIASRLGFDSKEFINRLMNSETGQRLYRKDSLDKWSSAYIILAEIERELQENNKSGISKGDVIDLDIMYWIGYLFRYWSLIYPDDSAKDMIRYAPIDKILDQYKKLENLEFERVIKEFKGDIE